MLDLAAVNWLAVFVAGAASFTLGGVWYSVLFAKPWMRHTGIDPEAADAEGGAKMALYYAGAFVTYFVAAAVLALLLEAVGAAGAGAGLLLGLLVGAGVVATVSLNTYLFSGRSVVLYLIDVGYPVVALALTGVILGVWQ